MVGNFTAVTAIPDLSLIVGSLTRFAGSLRSLKEPLERSVNEVIIPRIKENFASESDAGEGWDQLKPATVRQRGSAHPILQDSGKLLRVATSKHIWEIDGQAGTAQITSLPGVEYGFLHDTGTSIMAARPFANITEGDIAEIREIFEEFLQDRINAVTAGGVAVRSVLGQ